MDGPGRDANRAGSQPHRKFDGGTQAVPPSNLPARRDRATAEKRREMIERFTGTFMGTPVSNDSCAASTTRGGAPFAAECTRSTGCIRREGLRGRRTWAGHQWEGKPAAQKARRRHSGRVPPSNLPAGSGRATAERRREVIERYTGTFTGTPVSNDSCAASVTQVAHPLPPNAPLALVGLASVGGHLK